ncbi:MULTISPECIES: hypothetical protein [Burkholderia]|uniref:hypothetical protein n=1 Tax=Burkholderia TaxID=32008 RepID=UPI000841908B|nr:MULTISPECIES: hypothetical protein [unclassified Burkholderia]AOK28859.1 hypothetical protein AQ611_04880 [Burkholderia sp. Bp7605]
MSRIQKALNDLATSRNASFVTKATGAPVELYDDGASFAPIQVTTVGHWFTAADLRHAAKLFKKLADQLDAEGRNE